MGAIFYKDKVYGAGGASGGGGSSTLAGLSDVNLSSPTDGQVLVYNDTNDEWVNANPTGGASTVSDLTDVDLTNLANGQILKYNSTTQKWENANESGGGGGGAGYTETTLFTGSYQITSGEITLNDDIDKYDQIIIWTSWNTTTAQGEVPFMVDAKYFADTFLYNSGSTSVANPHLFCFLYSNQYIRIKCGSTKNKLFLYDSHSGAVIKVTGLKYGGGGSAGGYSRTELFKSSTNLAVWDASGITLSDDIENYDEIEFVLGFASGTDLSKRTNKFGAKWFADNFAYSSAVATVSHALLLLWPNQGFSAAWDSANQKIMMWGRNGTAGMFAVYGIKY